MKTSEEFKKLLYNFDFYDEDNFYYAINNSYQLEISRSTNRKYFMWLHNNYDESYFLIDKIFSISGKGLKDLYMKDMTFEEICYFYEILYKILKLKIFF